jgi:hypothetical protein
MEIKNARIILVEKNEKKRSFWEKERYNIKVYREEIVSMCNRFI